MATKADLDVKPFRRGKSKSKSKQKKTKEQLEEERKQREAERARRDAEKAKKRLTLRTKIQTQKENTKKKPPATPNTTAAIEKEQRKKVLRFRRAQSRFALPKIDFDDTLDDIARANAELEDAINNNEDANNPVSITITSDDNTSSKPRFPDTFPDKEQDNDNDEKQRSESVASAASVQSVEELTLSTEQEAALNQLQNDLEESDPDYYGFVDYKRFMNILKKNDIALSAKHETFLMGALTLIDEGVDYYDFSRKIREMGRTLQPDNTLQDICEEIAEGVEKDREKKEALPSTNLDDIESKDIVNLDDDAFEAFYAESVKNRGRGMSLARMQPASKNVNKQTRLGELVDDLALDGAEIDFALLKTALATIDCYPKDKEVKYLINHLCEDGTGFVDFNYLITFLQETSGVPAKKWTRIEKIISKVVNQLQMVERAEVRKKQQEEKLKARLEKKRASRQPKQINDEMTQLAADEKRLRALKLRDKAKLLK
eukprot:164402_1